LAYAHNVQNPQFLEGNQTDFLQEIEDFVYLRLSDLYGFVVILLNSDQTTKTVHIKVFPLHAVQAQSGNRGIALLQACSTFYVVRKTSAKFGLQTGNMRVSTQNEE
jgi:hypothetical protein